MSIIGNLGGGLQAISQNFTVEVLAQPLQPAIDDALKRHGKADQRKSPLSPPLITWLILALPLRRDLSYPNLLAWLVSGLRWLGWPMSRKPVAEGTVTHARKRIGVSVLRDVFVATRNTVKQLGADFHGFLSLAIDGTGLTMPDTPENREHFRKPGSGRGTSAFPQTRLVGLVAVVTQAVFDAAFGPYCGKGTGERTLGMELILRNAAPGVLFLLDRGFYGFDLLDAILQRQAAFLIRVPNHVKLRRISRSTLPDGSYYAWLVGKIEADEPRADGRKRWIEVRRKIRVIEYQIRGFSKTRLATSLLDPTIEARELVRHYHRRWEVELAYDSVKTHQSARRTGQCPTVLRSKLPALVEQEVYAMLAVYNVLRELINQAAKKHGMDPLSLSFVGALQTVIDAIPGMQRAPTGRLPWLYEQLLDEIATCAMDRWRRKRAYPRVVKVKMSNFRLKRPAHRQTFRDFEPETKILGQLMRSK